MKPPQCATALIAASLLMACPARADKVLCDGIMLCLAATVPLLLAGVAFYELKTKAP